MPCKNSQWNVLLCEPKLCSSIVRTGKEIGTKRREFNIPNREAMTMKDTHEISILK